MQDLHNTESYDEINLRDLFITLWAYKLLIASTCALGVLFGGYHALNTKKQYTSTAIFKLDQDNSDNLSLIGQYSSVAKITGISDKPNIPEDMVKGRVFIEKLDEQLDFQSDSYFNSYNPNSIDPIWKSTIKSAIGWQKTFVDTNEAMWESIIRKYSKSVQLSAKENTLKIQVTHENPQRAAKIANVIMNTIINDRKNKKYNDQDEMLSYLSNTLANALIDLEASQSKLKEFTLKNSALPLESFAAGSLKLSALREQLSQASDFHKAVAALSLMLENKTTSQNDYLTLRQKHPIVDQVEFRRILGLNEIISSWSWPEASYVDAVFGMLSERKTRLQTEINKSQIEAERSSLALQTYAKLERDANIAEASYTVLIEQVKAKTTAAGFRPDNTEIYEYASVSTNPSAPILVQVLAIGALLGLFFGGALSLFFAHNLGVYYSKMSLQTGAQARLTASIRSILSFRNKSLNAINMILAKKPLTILRDLTVEIHISNSTQVVVTSLHAKLTGNDVARALASYMQSDSVRVAVIDFSSKDRNLDNKEEKLSVGSFVITETVGNVSILRPSDDLEAIELLSKTDFAKNLNSLSSTIDFLFLCADNKDAISLSRALQGQKSFHIMLARTKHTKLADLAQIKLLLPIQGLLHD